MLTTMGPLAAWAANNAPQASQVAGQTLTLGGSNVTLKADQLATDPGDILSVVNATYGLGNIVGLDWSSKDLVLIPVGAGNTSVTASVYDTGGLGVDVTFNVTVNTPSGNMTFTYTDNDADHIYFNGDTLGVTVSGLNIPNGDVRAALGVMIGNQFDSSKPVLNGMLNAGSYNYKDATVTNGSLTVSGSVYNPGNTYLPTGAIGLQLYTNQNGTWQPLGQAAPIQPAGGRQAITGVFIPDGNVTASPALETFTNLYSTEKDITFTRTDPMGYMGSIRFSPGLNIIEDIQQLDALQQNITLLGAIDVLTGKITYMAGIETSTLTFLQGKGASISIQGLPSGLANINITNNDLTAQVLSQSFSNGALTFTVNHFSSYRMTGDPPAPPTFVSGTTNPAGTKVIVAFNKAMANPAGKHGQFTVTVNGTQNAVTAADLNADPTKIELALTDPVINGDVVTVAYTAGSVKAADGGVLENFAAQSVTNNAPVRITQQTVSVDSNNKNLAVTGTTPAATVTVPSSVTDAVINVATLINAPAGGTVTTDPLPALNIQATTAISNDPVRVAIPAGTTVSAAAAGNWDGTINVPTVKPNNSVVVTPDPGKDAAVDTVIEVGFGDVALTFSKAVRILIPGQAGKDAGYYRGVTFTKITRTCQEDSQVWADNDTNIPAGEDGKIDVGSDLIIWTKHFTRFIAYSQTSSGGGGGGGGGDMPSEGKTVTSSGGTVTESGATITIPAGAVPDDIKVKVERIINASGLPVAAGSRLVSDVHEITKDRSGNFTKPVTITLAFDKSKVDAAKYNVSIYWLDEGAKKWVELKNVKVDPAAGKVSGEAEHFTKFAVLATEKSVEPGVTLKDIAGHWSEAAIKTLVGSGAISGYPEGTFRPDSRITRAEFAAVMVKAFKLQPKGGKVFEDTAGHWARDAIATAGAHGIVNGYGDTSFGPDDPITREQMAVMIVIAAKPAPVTDQASFADGADISGWARDAVATATKKGIMKGYPDNTVKPKGSATRAEAVAVVFNALK